jgi:8-oxo-dGTP pyrophosphatase MutT (NUDIX family)
MTNVDDADALRAHDRSLARKTMAASVLFRDPAGRVLLVDPAYKPLWELTGGSLEVGESPRAAARREIREELGLDVQPGRILAVAWLSPTPHGSDGVVIVFDGGILDPEQVARIRLPADELAGHRFVDLEAAGTMLPAEQYGRLCASIQALAEHGTVYLEDGVVVGATRSQPVDVSGCK